MKIYVAHSRSFDFKKELYEPIRQSSLNGEHTFVLPHETSDEPFNSKDYLKNEAELLIAEVSEPATGLGIELGWADTYGVPIVCIFKKGSKVSGSLKVVSKNFVEYSNNKELIFGIEQILNQM
ncbi:MAG: hypothetical protein COV59_03240 [Candidatus Magasanikbacteria bacterium CG11_big_fil_rev_8_21_14_0_20_39_34]|uniref:Nucleoside 2-deoxyribosyltransferase n=1 Tax=Candidatus Magasanikbacteria bacterium CG11_big_fil_rev_8_21_14_0_20_39_34 TaxID=1974653 RepID=A0A2H0N5J9_9BACT|nr:MAG: hypothetical protein COV59_03240 [Candidatus Magasanikbacteria bacterium CG11_big_fil_rev_8_21_14_0_20_39_34]